MEVVARSLDALLHKATDAKLSTPEPVATEAFLAVLGESPNGAYLATRAIASRIRSPHPAEALLALDLLDACMKRCDAAFHAEIDKFRFLNEMIKLVSPKYYGNRTAPAVRQKVLDLMRAWTLDYPRDVKIKDAYEMLKKQGVVKDTPPPPPPPPQQQQHKTDDIFTDEENAKTLQRLLRSKNRNDLQAANRLIKTMVREGEKRNEAITRRITELHTVQNNVELLNEMLDQYDSATSSTEDLELIREIHTECNRLRPTICKLAAETQQSDDILTDVIEINDELDKVLQKYSVIVSRKSTAIVNAERNNVAEDSPARTSFLDLLSTDTADKNSRKENIPCNRNLQLEELGDIFSYENNASNLNVSPGLPVLTPVNIMHQSSSKDILDEKSDHSAKGLDELNVLSQELMKLSLPPKHEFTLPFNSQRVEKVSMNAMCKNQSNIIKTESKSPQNATQDMINKMLDLDFLIQKTLKLEENTDIDSSTNDEIMVDLSSDDNLLDNKLKSVTETNSIDKTNTEYPKSINNTAINNESPIINKTNEIKTLNDLDLNLESIAPSTKAPITIFEEDEGITVVLHFAKNKPRPDVSVLVVSSTSRCSSLVTDYKFHAVVPKSCKVKLLQPSGNTFPPFSPFLPPAAITQIVLIARPVSSLKEIFLKFVISYSYQNDSVSEIGEVKCLDLDDA